MSIDRFDLVKESFEKKAVPAECPAGKTSDYFGELVFDRAKMRKYLDVKTLNALIDCIDKGKSLDRETADGVAKGMKEWAMEHHVTHVTHWFQPLTEGTAEKHDSLIDYDGKGGVIETFDGKSLAQQEPDASSFPAASAPPSRRGATRPGIRLPRCSSLMTRSASRRCSPPRPASSRRFKRRPTPPACAAPASCSATSARSCT